MSKVQDKESAINSWYFTVLKTMKIRWRLSFRNQHFKIRCI